jgi:hypothetical protein
VFRGGLEFWTVIFDKSLLASKELATCRSLLVLLVGVGFLGEEITLLGDDCPPMKRAKTEMFFVTIAQKGEALSKAAAGDLIIVYA